MSWPWKVNTVLVITERGTAGSKTAYIGSPLVVPAWAILNITASLVFWIYIVSPALYYSNTWQSAYLPIQSNSIFDNTEKTYNVSKVIEKAHDFTFNETKYEAYSDVSRPQPSPVSQKSSNDLITDLSARDVRLQYVWPVLRDRLLPLRLALPRQATQHHDRVLHFSDTQDVRTQVHWPGEPPTCI